MSKKKILVFMDWYLPGYKAGGPIRSVANIVAALSNYYDFYIITRNTDLVDETPYAEIQPNVWLKKFGTNIYYLDNVSYSKEKIKALISERDYDVMYLNSLYSAQYTLTPLRLRNKFFPNLKTVLAPRGMLGEGALKTKSFKKSIFLTVTKFAKFFNDIIWHATSEDEKKLILNQFGSKSIIKVGEPISIPIQFDSTQKTSKEKGLANFFYIGRVSEHKNILFALENFVNQKPKGEILFDIFGPEEEPDYMKKIQLLIEQMPNNIKVNYRGAIPNEKLKHRLQSEYHFLILPTKGENYSHAVVDSWNSGCPVLVSDKTPWNELANKNIGWNFQLNNSVEFIKSINQAVNLNQEEFNKMSKNCVDFYNQTVCSEEITLKNKMIFE